MSQPAELQATENTKSIAAWWWKHRSWLFGLLILGLVCFYVLQGVELERFRELLREAAPTWLLLGIGLQVLTYLSAAAVWHTALASAGARRRFWSLVPLGVAKLFTDQALPSGGISGTLLVIRGLARRGIAAPVAMGALLVGLVSFYASYGLAALFGFLTLWRNQGLGTPVAVIYVIFAGFVIGVPIIVLSLRSMREGPWGARLRRIPGATALLDAIADAPPHLLRNPALLLVATGLQFAIFLLDAATLDAMLAALGQHLSPILVFASFITADVVATIGPIPLGLGTFEGTAVALLTIAGIPIEAAFAATLLLRSFTFWLPMLPGLWLAHRELG
jgi:uncharacterized membrane protein YbhN (UPF0104 family)